MLSEGLGSYKTRIASKGTRRPVSGSRGGAGRETSLKSGRVSAPSSGRRGLPLRKSCPLFIKGSSQEVQGLLDRGRVHHSLWDYGAGQKAGVCESGRGEAASQATAAGPPEPSRGQVPREPRDAASGEATGTHQEAHLSAGPRLAPTLTPEATLASLASP